MHVADQPPLVYVESNWVIAHALAHDDAHKSATRLLQQAEAGECELRIPLAAVLESRGSLANAMRRLYEPLERVRNTLHKAYRNGIAELNKVEVALADVAAHAYIKADTEALRQKLLAKRSVTQFCEPEAELLLMHDLSPLVRMDGMDVKDFYILVGVLVDRAAATRPNRPAIFFSTNKEEFEPGKKFDSALYGEHRIVWRPDFQLAAGLKDWAEQFP